MLNEIRVNLKHLLEDIRDSYVSPLEEVITESKDGYGSQCATT